MFARGAPIIYYGTEQGLDGHQANVLEQLGCKKHVGLAWTITSCVSDVKLTIIPCFIPLDVCEGSENKPQIPKESSLTKRGQTGQRWLRKNSESSWQLMFAQPDSQTHWERSGQAYVRESLWQSRQLILIAAQMILQIDILRCFISIIGNSQEWHGRLNWLTRKNQNKKPSKQQISLLDECCQLQFCMCWDSLICQIQHFNMAVQIHQGAVPWQDMN